MAGRHRRGLGFRLKVVERRHKGLATGAIHQRVVHFGIDRKAALGKIRNIVQPLDDIGLPQGARHIEWPGMQTRYLNAKLPPIPRLGQCDMAHMEFHIKVGIQHPIGFIQAGRHFHQASAKQWHAAKTLFKICNDLLKTHKATRRRGGIIKSNAAHMLRRIGLFEIDKRSVENSQLLHFVLHSL